MRNLFFLVFFALSVASAAAQSAQTILLTGKVVDASGASAPGVSIRVRGTETGANTDVDGGFSVRIPIGNQTIVISAIGQETIEVAIRAMAGNDQQLPVQILKESTSSLNDVVVTGQFEPQSLRKSVYQVRTIDSERIRLRGATSIQSILNTELGMRFSNDLTLGTTDVQLMGMSGQNVKILLDGVPMVDRGGTRESIGQIDINTVERIEIVEGPMSVIYGTDALAGVINIITKKGIDGNNFTVNARVQEETAGKEYAAFTGDGVHNQSVGLTWQRKAWQIAGNVTRNNFGGWQGTSVGRNKAWMPKDQMLYTASVRYNLAKWNIWYRFNGTDEGIHYLGTVNQLNTAGDKDYNTSRWFHQAQAEYRQNDKLSFIGALSYTDYSRKTLSTNIDFNTGRRTLSLDAGAQDKSVFTTTFFRGTTQYKISPAIFLIAGIDFSNNNSSGQRIQGTPTINEYAVFISPDISLNSSIKISPGLRFLKNSVYDAPPVIPSLNAKFTVSKTLDIRIGYARGFRSPALRELYFTFFDASHSIRGNVNLKAEYSNSFNTFFVLQTVNRPHLRASTTFGAFYNDFHDLIDTGVDPADRTLTTYLNVSRFKTTGFTVDNKLFHKYFQATLGASYIARYNQLTAAPDAYGETPEFTWSPEVNANFLYTFHRLGATANLFYKYTGSRKSYEAVVNSTGVISVNLANTQGFHMADFTVTKSFSKVVTLMGGIKNLFDVTNLRNTSADTGAHSAGSSIPLTYGRSYFLGLTFQWSKN